MDNSAKENEEANFRHQHVSVDENCGPLAPHVLEGWLVYYVDGIFNGAEIKA